MKIMKKIASVLLAMVMTFALSTPVFAAETTYTITAPNNGHTYEIYQIFTGDLDGKVLSNVKWGENGTGETDTVVDSTVLEKLTALNTSSDTEKLAVIAEYVDLTTTPVATLDKDTTSVNVVGGYYLIKDKDGSVPDNDTYTKYIVKIVGDVTIDPKSDKPTSEKKVKDTNDSTEATTDWQDSADYDIGDKVPFQLKATIGSDYDNYKTYYLVFHDVEEKGLTFDQDSVKVYVGGNEITSGYEVVTTGLDDECTFEVVFDNLKEVTSVKAGSVITVEYKSTLNENAVIGNPGNKNTMNIEYSNNPNDEQGGTAKTPDDTVVVFTYETIIEKVDEKGKALEGATFILEKYNKTKDTWEAVQQVETTPGTTFTFSGLDDGDYRLKETDTPDGYNSIADIYFTVTANHTVVEGENGIVLETLSVHVTSGNAEFAANVNSGKVTKLDTSEKELTSGQIYAEIVNYAGATLPETGGIGTTVFYALGSILVVGAVVLLISKKRMDAK